MLFNGNVIKFYECWQELWVQYTQHASLTRAFNMNINNTYVDHNHYMFRCKFFSLTPSCINPSAICFWYDNFHFHFSNFSFAIMMCIFSLTWKKCECRRRKNYEHVNEVFNLTRVCYSGGLLKRVFSIFPSYFHGLIIWKFSIMKWKNCNLHINSNEFSYHAHSE